MVQGKVIKENDQKEVVKMVVFIDDIIDCLGNKVD